MNLFLNTLNQIAPNYKRKDNLFEYDNVAILYLFEQVFSKQYLKDLHDSYDKRLIIIFDSLYKKDKDKYDSLLEIAIGKPRRIYARQCEIKQISNKEARPLNEQVHMQGHRNAQVTYGLYYKDELVQLMSFSRTRWNRNLSSNHWEIIRGCPGSNNIVVGGCSKCFSHFIKDYDPDLVFSYCDDNLFSGTSYTKLGMVYAGSTGPNKWWLIDGQLIPRNPNKYQEYKKLSNNTVVWGAGSSRYVWTKKGVQYEGAGKDVWLRLSSQV